MANNYGGNFPSFDEYLNQHNVRRDRQRYPFYDDNSDYNTNSKSYYDDLARKQKLFEILAKRIWEYDEELAKRFEEWDKNLEELPDDVMKLVEEWLKNTDEDLYNFIRQELVFDINEIEPKFITNLGAVRNAVNQSVNIDLKDNNVYVTQSDNKKNEGFIITRVTPSGKYVSSMYIPGGGHGSTIGLDRKTNGDLKIWLYHNSLKKLIQVEYQDEYELTEEKAREFTDYTPQSVKGHYFTPVFDPYYDYLLLRRDDGVCELRKREDVREFKDDVLYSLTIPEKYRNEYQPLQGIVSYGTDLYYQSGWSQDNENYKGQLISKFDFKTGKQRFEKYVDNVPTELGKDMYRENYNEPEGLAYYVDIYGKHSLLFVMTGGEIGKRFQMLYAYVQRGGERHWDTIINTGSQLYPLTRADGRAWGIPSNVKKLSDFLEVGTYYIPGSQANELEDFPYKPNKKGDNSGWWLENKPSEQHYNLIQTLTRYSLSRKLFKMTRVVEKETVYTNNAKVGIWTIENTSSYNGEYALAIDFNNKLSNIIYPGEYYFTNNETTKYEDFPQKYKEIGGFRLFVSNGDNTRTIIQTLQLKSTVRKYIAWRHVSVENDTASEWVYEMNGVLNYEEIINPENGVTLDNLRIADNGDELIIRGIFEVDKTFTEKGKKLFDLPNNIDAPSEMWIAPIYTDIKSSKIIVTSPSFIRFNTDRGVTFYNNNGENRFLCDLKIPKY